MPRESLRELSPQERIRAKEIRRKIIVVCENFLNGRTNVLLADDQQNPLVVEARRRKRPNVQKAIARLRIDRVQSATDKKDGKRYFKEPTIYQLRPESAFIDNDITNPDDVNTQISGRSASPEELEDLLRVLRESHEIESEFTQYRNRI